MKKLFVRNSAGEERQVTNVPVDATIDLKPINPEAIGYGFLLFIKQGSNTLAFIPDVQEFWEESIIIGNAQKILWIEENKKE